MSEDAQDRVEKIFAAVLKSISKILANNNFQLRDSVELLKRAMVTAATEDGAASDSLISLRTGVHRKDVKRIREGVNSNFAENPPTKGLARVLSLWANDPRFCDPDGKPRLLLRADTGDQPGFDSLVRTSKVDLAPATVLQELVTQSLVLQHDDGGIELLSTTFVGRSGPAALRAFEATVTDHLRIAVDNVLSPPGAPRQFDQVVRYSHLSDASVEKLETEARKLARAYLEHMNAMAHRLQSEDDATGQLANGRFVSGVFIAPTRTEQALETEQAAAPAKKAQDQ